MGRSRKGGRRRKRTGGGQVRTGENATEINGSTSADSTGAPGAGTGEGTGAGTEEIDRMGLVSMNEVTIDEAALAAEADAALASAEIPTEAPADAPAAPETGESWGPFVAGLIPTLRGVVFAQWQIHQAQLDELQQSLTICLDQAFPGGLAGKYACWVRLAMCCTGIAAGNMVANGGKLPPLGLPRAEHAEHNESRSDDATAAAH